MKSFNLTLSLVCISTICFLVSCKPDPEMSISPDQPTLSFSAEGGQEIITVKSKHTTWSVHIIQEGNWLSYVNSSESVTLTASENNSLKEKSATVTIKCKEDNSLSKTINVTQQAKDVIVSISGLDAPFNATDKSRGAGQSLSINCNTNWWIEGKPDWLDISNLDGTNNSNITVWPNCENSSSSERTATLTIKAGDKQNNQVLKEVSKTIKQRGSDISPVFATPSNAVALTESIAWGYDFSSDLHHVYFTLMNTIDANAMTDGDIKSYVERSADNDSHWMKRTPEQFRVYGNAFSFYGLTSNTSYTIISVPFDSSNRVGTINRTSLSTKVNNVYQSPWTSNVMFGPEMIGSQVVWRIIVEKDAEHGAYADKFYSWAIVGTTAFKTLDATDAQLAYYMKQEISKNPSPHDTHINSSDRSIIRERLEGPVSEANYTLPANYLNDHYLQVVNWCILANGEYSGVIFNGFVDLTESDVKKHQKVSAYSKEKKSQFSQFNPKEFSNNFKLIRLH